MRDRWRINIEDRKDIYIKEWEVESRDNLASSQYAGSRI